MTGIPDTTAALAELQQLAQERAALISAGGAPAGSIDRLANLRRAIQIVQLASMITYFEASDTDPPK
jgi:hypothetical protein